MLAVYAAGYETNAAGKAVAKVWKNGTATPVLTDGTKDDSASALAVAGGDVYAAGYEFSAANVKVAKYWKGGTGTAFTATPITDGEKDSEIRAIVLAT